MKEVQIEFPAYNIFFRQGGMWIMHNEPVIGKPFQEVQNIATGILFGSKETDAVRIYGVFNCQQTLIREIEKSSWKMHGSDEDRMRTAIKGAIEICNEMLMKGTWLREGTSQSFAKIKEVLSEAIAPSN